MTMPNGGALPAMPPGIGSSSSSNPGTDTAAATPPAAGRAPWSPPFQIGKGKTGVFTDPREQIAGGTYSDIVTDDPNNPAKSATNPNGDPGGTPGTPSDPNSVQYSSPGTGSMPSGGAISPVPKPRLNLPGSIDDRIAEGMNY